jgi:hypothetical protein
MSIHDKQCQNRGSHAFACQPADGWGQRELQMKNTVRTNVRLLLAILLLAGSLFAQAPTGLYPGYGTTLNGNAVYFAVAIATGAEVKTAGIASTIVFGGTELEMAPYSRVIVGSPFVLSCGSVRVAAGSTEISDGNHVVTVSSGQVARFEAPFCNEGLPDAPSSVLDGDTRVSDRHGSRQHRDGVPVPAFRSGYVDFAVADGAYWAVTGAMFSSSVMTAELTQRCLKSGACTAVPDVFRTRKAMYGAGLPVSAGVAYFSYYLKARRFKLWWLPQVIVIGGEMIVSTHAAHYSH